MRGRVGEPPYLKYSELHKTKSHVLKRDLVRTNIKKILQTDIQQVGKNERKCQAHNNVSILSTRVSC